MQYPIGIIDEKALARFIDEVVYRAAEPLISQYLNEMGLLDPWEMPELLTAEL